MGRSLTLLLVLVPALGSAQSKPEFLNKINSQAEFDRLARVTTTPYELPHILFLIDRKDKDKVYYADSKRSWGHHEFANAMYLSLDNGTQFVQNNYYSPNRRFILGWVSFYTPVKKWTYEFWEGDQLSKELIAEADEALNSTFFTPLAIKPNSLDQEGFSTGMPGRLLPTELANAVPYQPMNIGRTVGRLRLLPKYDGTEILSSQDLPVLDEFPISITPVAGMIAARPTTALSHLNILARTWGVPSIYVKDAWSVLKQFDGQWVSLNAKTGKYWIRLANKEEIAAAEAKALKAKKLATPPYDLATQNLTELSAQRASLVTAFGAKSANLGEAFNAHIEGATVPSGFTVPFYWYDRFVSENGLKPLIAKIVSDSQMRTDRARARQALADLRHRIETGDLDPHFKSALLKRVSDNYGDKGLFVRSSTNAEDLPNFSGAGLYTTVPNVKGDQAIIDALRKVWASVWNDEAFFAREQAGIDHQKVFMAVLLQVGIESDSAGVMITTNPFDPSDPGAIFISAKRGLGIKVVEGKKVPEQLIYRRRTNAIQVLTRSAEDSLLSFDENGGIKEVPIVGDRAVLTDEMVRRLAAVAVKLKQTFHGVEQDIEWAFHDGKVYILQSRPYKT
jgi:hypothetical protein